MPTPVEKAARPLGRPTGNPGTGQSPDLAIQRSATWFHIRWPEWSVLSLYAALVAFSIPYHEPWADEAQAWQLARSLSLPSLFLTYIRYEASPGLWHFLLWVMIRAHISYTSLHWICGAIAVAATTLLVMKSPFPRYLKLILPFTCFLLFQYAVVARSYVLVPLCLYLIALCWKRSPLVLALLLGLLANLALHAAAISGGLACVYFIEQVRNGGVSALRRREFLLSAFILAGCYAIALWTAWPPHDLMNYISTVRGQSRPVFVMGFISLVWGICQPWVLSVAFWIAIALCLRRRRSLIYLFPVLLFAAFCAAVHFAWWHVGLLVPLVICLMWITWPVAADSVSRPEVIGRIAMVGMAIVQILWSAYAIEFDHYHAYSPDLAAAEYLRPFVRQGVRIAVTCMGDPGCQAYNSVGILPYFDHNIYMNQPDSFWWWSTQNQTEEMFNKALPSHPDIVIVEVRTLHPEIPINLVDPKVELLSRAGYRFTYMFCGALPVRLQLTEKRCHLLFQ
jgi:hypothetical protein